jgi:calcium-binding protein CML
MLSLKQIRKRFTTSDLADIFNEIDEGENRLITVDALIHFVDQSITKSRALALKTRSAVLKSYHGESEYRDMIESFANNITEIIEKERFTQFMEDILRMSINENDSIGVYSLFDIDGDGKVSVDDFVGFISGQSREATKILASGNPKTIVDVRCSSGSASVRAAMDAEYLRQGYTQILPKDMGGPAVRFEVGKHGSFGSGESLWIWRREQGTCSGRFRPIIDIQLTEKIAQPGLVLNGYTAIRGSFTGRRMWIKRSTSLEEDKEGLIDLQIKLGKASDPSNDMHFAPGVGWVKVDGNFNKGFFFSNAFDAYLWLLPQNTRNPNHIYELGALVRRAANLSESTRKEVLYMVTREALRSYIPYKEVKEAACIPPRYKLSGTSIRAAPGSAKLNSFTTSGKTPAQAGGLGAMVGGGRVANMNTAVHSINRTYDFSNLFHEAEYGTHGTGTMSYNSFIRLLKHAGIQTDVHDLPALYRNFDNGLNNVVSREEYAKEITLSDFEVDETISQIRQKLIPSNLRVAVDVNEFMDSAALMELHDKEQKKTRLLTQIFRLVNTDRDGIISLSEFMDLMNALGVYLTEEECRKVIKDMDLDGDDRVEEGDFVSYMRKSHKSDRYSKKSHRLREASNTFRQYLQRGATSAPGRFDANATDFPVGQDRFGNESQWEELKKRHQQGYGGERDFPNYLDAVDIKLLMSNLGQPVSVQGSKEMMIFVAPDGLGKVTQGELSDFMNRRTRTFGELFAVLDRDLLKPLMDAYRDYVSAFRSKTQVAHARMNDYENYVREVLTDINQTPAASGSAGNHSPRATEHMSSGVVLEIVAVSQVKGGIETTMARSKTFEMQPLNTEEWAAMAALTGDLIATDGNYGIDAGNFIKHLCHAIYEESTIGSSPVKNGESQSFERLVTQFHKLIKEEASTAGGGLKLDYRAAFDLINNDGDEVLSMAELKSHLVRLQLSELCPEQEMPKFFRLLDTTNKGYITYDDFIKFIGASQDYLIQHNYGGTGVGTLGDEGDIMGTGISEQPPVAVTKNADCDYLVWFIWRQCLRLDENDPAAIVTELEAACAESELTQAEGTITIKELWNIMFELQIQTHGNISKASYEKGIKYLLHDPRDANRDGNDRYVTSVHDMKVDYSALCRLVMRMGREYESIVSDRKVENMSRYQRLRSDLIQFLRSVDDGDIATGYTPRDPVTGLERMTSREHSREHHIMRFERVFKRLDSDGDGRISPTEFKQGLRRLSYSNEKEWNLSMIQFLFGELDTDYDGQLNLQELSRFIRLDPGMHPVKDTQFKLDMQGAPPAYGNDEEDDLFGSHHYVPGESELFYKVFNCLKDVVPTKGAAPPIDAIRDAIRKHFLRHDTDNKGCVSEDRFRAFLRKSMLLDRMTAGECRRLMDALKRRTTAFGSSYSQVVVIDYEKLVVHLQEVSEHGPSRKPDIITMKLREAAAASAKIGRPFMNLCTLVDPQGHGRISKEELLFVFKMMGTVLSVTDVDSLTPLLQDGTIDRDGSVDYKDINYLLYDDRSVAGGNTGIMAMGPSSFTRQTGMLPPGNHGMTPFPVPHDYTTPGPQGGLGGFHTRLPTPPLPSGIDLVGDRDMQIIYSKISAEVNRRRRNNPSFSLHRLLGESDHNRSGRIPLSALLNRLEEMDIFLTTGDSLVMESNYSDLVDYARFANTALGEDGLHKMPPGAGGRALSPIPYYMSDNSTMIRLNELRGNGMTPREIFQVHDPDTTGLMDKQRFKDILARNNLLPYEVHAEAALEYICLTNKELVSYDSFCRDLELAYQSSVGGIGNVRQSSDGYNTAPPPPSRYSGYQESKTAGWRDREELFTEPVRNYGSRIGGGYHGVEYGSTSNDRWRDRDGDVMASREVDRWYNDPSTSPKRRRDYDNVRESVNRYSRDRDNGISLDRGSTLRPLRPPTVSESQTFSRSRARSPAPYGRDSREELRLSREASPRPARSSPSRIGVKMWGSQTSLDLKGKAPTVDSGHWFCPVCLYPENEHNDAKCRICSTPNYKSNPDYVLKNTCLNCTFENGAFAKNCEMCGEPVK